MVEAKAMVEATVVVTLIIRGILENQISIETVSWMIEIGIDVIPVADQVACNGFWLGMGAFAWSDVLLTKFNRKSATRGNQKSHIDYADWMHCELIRAKSNQF